MDRKIVRGSVIAAGLLLAALLSLGLRSPSLAGGGTGAPGCAATTVARAQAPAPSPAPPAAPAPPARVVVAGAGDIILHGRVHLSAQQRSRGEENNQGYDELFDGVAAALAGADVSVANLEFPILKEHKPAKPFIFSGDPYALRAASRAGFTGFTSANNHAYDQGRAGVESTARLCKKEGDVCLGVGESREDAERPLLFERNGIRLAVIGYTTVANDNMNSKLGIAPHVNGYDADNLVAQVQAQAANADCVVVVIHWGEEYREQPTPDQRALAARLTAAGACLVIGHHPHVIEPIEPAAMPDGRRALVAYSLGNFVSNQERKNPEHENRIGAILRVTLVKGPKGVEVESWESLPVWMRNVTEFESSRSYEDMEVVVLPAALREVEAKLATASAADRPALERERDFYRGRIEAAERMLVAPRSP